MPYLDLRSERGYNVLFVCEWKCIRSCLVLENRRSQTRQMRGITLLEVRRRLSDRMSSCIFATESSFVPSELIKSYRK